MRLRRAVAFEVDLDENLEHIAGDDPLAAIKVLDAIEDQAALLLDNPGLGRPGRVVKTRELVVAGTRYIVAYRVHGEEIQLLRLLHGAQRWPDRM
jgi:plasmid stabilization system protein ParE